MIRALGLVLAGAAIGFAALAPGLLHAPPAHADATILSATVENGFPKQLTFKLTAQASADITEVTLSYAITGRGTSALGKPSDLATGKTLSTSVAVQVNSGSSYIPVGSEFVYHWELTTADGAKTIGPEAKFFYLPPGVDWKSVSGDFMTVYFHPGRESLADAYLKAGIDTLDKMGTKLLNTKLKQLPVNVILFEDEKEMTAAKAGTSGKFDASVTNCGQKVTNDIVLVIPLSCGTPDRTDTLRHEFTHIIDDAAGISALGKLPSWLDEGTAVYGQTTPGSGYAGAVQSAARANRLIPFAQMASYPTDARLVDLFYGQAYTMVKYLIDKGGPAQYAKLFATIKEGNRFDDALKQVYSLDMAGFEKEFLAAVGSQPAAQPTTAPTTRPQQQTNPTTAPTKAPAAANPTVAATTASNASAKGDDAVDKVALVIGGIALLLVLLALLAFLVSMMLANNRRAGGPGGPPAAPPPAAG